MGAKWHDWFKGKAPSQLCVCVCTSADVHYAVDGVCVGFFFLPVNVTAENTSVCVAAAVSCQAGNSVGFGIISGHKFIGTACVGG